MFQILKCLSHLIDRQFILCFNWDIKENTKNTRDGYFCLHTKRFVSSLKGVDDN